MDIVILFVLLGLAAFVLFVAALVGVARARHLEPVAKAIWVVIIVVAPLLGPIAWFIVGAHPPRLHES
ncbi:PLDc N-terminal domain-containing protein [Actinotalea sp. BY-33]|uniref:PLDc N-terminal domain-containing protein n=1 Tax=Actinotalea soli TaxID=2819234 RepID=A0A939LS34_9CELL|nr:PLDc N-terminal domain-containing protein [Actinotalea soli]MBO1751099.1 PLDc N-terminal domain-containing protein [Actinotalea soli]